MSFFPALFYSLLVLPTGMDMNTFEQKIKILKSSNTKRDKIVNNDVFISLLQWEDQLFGYSIIINLVVKYTLPFLPRVRSV